jgi:hypothetical protein
MPKISPATAVHSSSVHGRLTAPSVFRQRTGQFSLKVLCREKVIKPETATL